VSMQESGVGQLTGARPSLRNAWMEDSVDPLLHARRCVSTRHCLEDRVCQEAPGISASLHAFHQVRWQGAETGLQLIDHRRAAP
jgi:hypothetical protein